MLSEPVYAHNLRVEVWETEEPQILGKIINDWLSKQPRERIVYGISFERSTIKLSAMVAYADKLLC